MENTDHPKYHTSNSIDKSRSTTYNVESIVRDWGLGFFWGNALKYLLQGRTREDFEKCQWYLQDILANNDQQTDGIGAITPFKVFYIWQLSTLQHSVLTFIYRENPAFAVRAIKRLLEDHDHHRELKEKIDQPPHEEC